MKKYNVGLVGYGWVATAHIPAINATPLAQVTAVCSSRTLDAAALSAQHGGRISVYNDLDEMLANPDIHVVSLCGLPTQRLDQVARAARAGKHLILEKPLCLSLKELRAMHKAVKRAKVKTCVCFECRFSSQFQVTKAILDKGLLGTVHYGEVDYYQIGCTKRSNGPRSRPASALSAASPASFRSPKPSWIRVYWARCTTARWIIIRSDAQSGQTGQGQDLRLL